MNYPIMNLNCNVFGKKSAQEKTKFYLREGRTVYLPFAIKFNEDKDQLKPVQLHAKWGENTAYQVIYDDLGSFVKL